MKLHINTRTASVNWLSHAANAAIFALFCIELSRSLTSVVLRQMRTSVAVPQATADILC